MTWGKLRTRANRASARLCTAGSVTCAPPWVAITSCSVSPENLGAAFWSSEIASNDSVWGSWKSSL